MTTTDQHLIGMQAAEQVLQHFGVKGMKWGVRRDRRAASGGSKSTEKVKPKKATADDVQAKTRDSSGRLEKSKPEAPAAPKTLSTMSDAELRNAIARIRMEQEYAQLTKAPPTAKEKAKAAAEEILWDVGKKQTKGLLNSLIGQQIKKATGIDTSKDKDKKKDDAPEKEPKSDKPKSDKPKSDKPKSDKPKSDKPKKPIDIGEIKLQPAEYTKAKMETEALLLELSKKKPIREITSS